MAAHVRRIRSDLLLSDCSPLCTHRVQPGRKEMDTALKFGMVCKAWRCRARTVLSNRIQYLPDQNAVQGLEMLEARSRYARKYNSVLARTCESHPDAQFHICQTGTSDQEDLSASPTNARRIVVPRRAFINR